MNRTERKLAKCLSKIRPPYGSRAHKGWDDAVEEVAEYLSTVRSDFDKDGFVADSYGVL